MVLSHIACRSTHLFYRKEQNNKFPPSNPSLLLPYPESVVHMPARCPQLTNPNVKLPINSLYEIPSLLSDHEANVLIKDIDAQNYSVEWRPEGYDRRHRVQRYLSSSSFSLSTSAKAIKAKEMIQGVQTKEEKESVDDDDNVMEKAFGWIFDRIISSQNNNNNDSSKLPSVMMHRPYEVVVIEHTPSSCQSTVKTFEQNSYCSCRSQQQCDDDNNNNNINNNNDGCNCYIAQLTLLNNAVQNMERPVIRHPECWDTDSNGETKLVMKKNSVIVKRGECLWNWRGCISEILCNDDDTASACDDKSNTHCQLPNGQFEADDVSAVTNNGCTTNDSNKVVDTTTVVTTNTYVKKFGKPWTRIPKMKALNIRCITITFRGICPPHPPNHSIPPTIPIQATQQSSPPKPLPLLSDLLTIIVTTSPIRSHPSTKLLEHTFDTFIHGGDDFAYNCRKVIICDGCRILEETKEKEEKKDEDNTTRRIPTITQKYANTKQTLRNGIATVDQARNYIEFKSRLRKLCHDANITDEKMKSPFRNTEVIELDERHGYGFALRHALYNHVHTPYVCVIQHDRTFMRTTPIQEVVHAMINDLQHKVKYVGMSMRSNLLYFDIFSGKYGRNAIDELRTLILRPPELCIGGNIYGPTGSSINDMTPPGTEKLGLDKRRLIFEELKKTYRGSHQCITQDEWLQSTILQDVQEDGYHQLSLTPTLFWYDNTHIVETAHYRDFVFNPQYKMVARGGFVEDKLSPCLVRSCERLGLTEGHAKYGCYILDDHSGVFFTGHLDGGSYQTKDLHVSPPLANGRS